MCALAGVSRAGFYRFPPDLPKADPEDAEKHFSLAFTLGRLGRDDEALAEYDAALRNPERLCAHCFRDSWNNIGWYYYRQGSLRTGRSKRN